MTTQKYTTIFFDWGGVIANDPGDEFLGQLLRDVGATDVQVQEIYEIALNRFGVTAQECVFIDDKQYCLDPAAQMGFKTILATNPEQIIRDINACLY